ncbi:hypothetical protein RFI_34821, partial [Reticulomyxa filosa]
ALLKGCTFSVTCTVKGQYLNTIYERMGYLVVSSNVHKERGNGVPLWVLSDREFYEETHHQNCFHGTQIFEQQLEFIASQLKRSSIFDQGLPLFIVLHTQINHGGQQHYFYSSQFAYQKFLQKVFSLRNTVLFLASDHGAYAGDLHQ